MPECDTKLSEQICVFMELIRNQKLEKIPGIAETIDWAKALVILHQDHLDPFMIEATLGILLKDRNDVENIKKSLKDLIESVGSKILELSNR